MSTKHSAAEAAADRDADVVSMAAARKRGKGSGGNVPGSTGNRYRVRVEKGRIGEVVDAVEEGIVLAGGCSLYARGETLGRVAAGERGRRDKGIRRDAAAPIFTIATPPMIHEIAEQTCEFWRQTDKGEAVIACPAAAPGVLLSRAGRWRFPELRGISEVPLLANDGRLICSGYDEHTGIVVCTDDDWPAIPARPTEDDARAGVRQIIELIDNFPFVDTADMATAVAAFLSAVVRPTIPTCPAFGFTAPVRGSGKSKLADVASVLATGRPGAAITWAPKEDENTKLLGAAAMAGDSVVLIDNIEVPVKSAALNSLLTQTMVAVRVLGLSKLVRVETSALYLLTGNNLIVQGDLTRRVLLVHLDPETERPELRRFDFDPVQRAREQRKTLVAGLLTLARWGQQNTTAGPSPLGSFEEWSRRVRNPLMALGLPDPCASMEALHRDDPERETALEVLTEWRREFSGAPTTVAEAIRRATNGGGMSLRNALDGVCGGPGGLNARRLGRYLLRLKDRVFGDLVLRRSADMYTNTATWATEKVTKS